MIDFSVVGKLDELEKKKDKPHRHYRIILVKCKSLLHYVIRWRKKRKGY